MSFSDKILLSHRRPRLRTKLGQFFKAQVREDLLLEIELLILAFATGIGDVTTYSEYRVFTANHTGNTLLLSVALTEGLYHVSGIEHVVPVPIQLIAVSLTMFLIGGWISGQLGHVFGCRQRWWLVANNFFQFLLFLSASMVQANEAGWSAPPRNTTVDISPHSEIVIALLAFSAGGQVAIARSLQMTEITTANATSAYVDLLIDVNLFQRRNRGRNRRLSFLICLVLGSLVGGFIYQNIGSPRTLFISAMGKFVVTSLLFFNRGGYFDTSTITRNEDDSLRSTSVNYQEFCYEEKATSPIIQAKSCKDDTSRQINEAYSDPRRNQVYISIPSWAITPAAYG